jgi:hypothetical protein
MRRVATAAETSGTPSASSSSGLSPKATCTWRRQRPSALSAPAPSSSAGLRGEAPLPLPAFWSTDVSTSVYFADSRNNNHAVNLSVWGIL